MFLALLISLATSKQNYAKLICACVPSKCDSYDDLCQGAPVLDPTSMAFNDDFTAARKNIKDITFRVSSIDSHTFDLDLRILAGLNIDFTSEGGEVRINFKYVSEDYGGKNFFFDDKYFPTFTPIDSTKSFRFGSIKSDKNYPLFERNGDDKIDIYYQEIQFTMKTLENVAGLYKTKPGNTLLNFGESDKIEVTFAYQVSDSKIKINGIDHPISYTKEDTYSFIGVFDNYPREEELNIIIGENLGPIEVPSFDISSISSVSIKGKLWSPTEIKPVQPIYKIYNLSIPSGDFPFNIYSNQIYLVVSGDTIMHGTIDAYTYQTSTASLYIDTKATSKVKLDIIGTIDSRIYPTSPFLDITLENYYFNESSRWSRDFPIGYSFNDKVYSHVLVKKVTFADEKKSTDGSQFYGFPSITTILSDEELDALDMFKKGFVFVELPINTLAADRIDTSAQFQSVSNIEGAPVIQDSLRTVIAWESFNHRTQRSRLSLQRRSKQHTTHQLRSVSPGELIAIMSKESITTIEKSNQLLMATSLSLSTQDTSE